MRNLTWQGLWTWLHQGSLFWLDLISTWLDKRLYLIYVFILALTWPGTWDNQDYGIHLTRDYGNNYNDQAEVYLVWHDLIKDLTWPGTWLDQGLNLTRDLTWLWTWLETWPNQRFDLTRDLILLLLSHNLFFSFPDGQTDRQTDTHTHTRTIIMTRLKSTWIKNEFQQFTIIVLTNAS